MIEIEIAQELKVDQSIISGRTRFVIGKIYCHFSKKRLLFLYIGV